MTDTDQNSAETPKPSTADDFHFTAKLGSANVKLMKPVKAHGGEVLELSFREPTGADIFEHGMPVTFIGNPPQPEIHERKMAAMMSHLAAVPTSTIAMLHPVDWTACAWAIADFFLPVLSKK